SQIQWRSDIDGLLGTGASLTYSMLPPGTHTISARVTDASGLAAEAHITVVVAHPPMVGIAAPPEGSVYYRTDPPVSFPGQTSDRDGALFTGASRALLLSEGSHVLTASVTDTDGASASAQVHVTIMPTPPVVTITAPPTGTRVFAGTNIPFAATAIDATDGNV